MELLAGGYNYGDKRYQQVYNVLPIRSGNSTTDSFTWDYSLALISVLPTSQTAYKDR